MPESPSSAFAGRESWPTPVGQEKRQMVGPLNRKPNASGSSSSGATRRSAIGLILGAPLLGACASVQQSISQFSNPFGGSEGPAGPQQEPTAVGSGQVKIGLILPLSAAGNAGVAALSMKNAAEMALAEFQNPNIQLLIKDDAGSPQGANAGAQQAVNEGAEIILGPLFAASVPAVAQVARTRGISALGLAAHSSVAGRGVRPRADRRGLEPAQHPDARHGLVGQSAGVCEPVAAGRPLRRAGSVGLPRFLRPLSLAVRLRAGSHCDACL